MVPGRSSKAIVVIVGLWVMACAAALALATTSDQAAAQGCGGGSPSPSQSASPSPSESGGGGFPPSIPPSLIPGRQEKVVPPAPPRLDPNEEVPVTTAQQNECKSTITIAYESGKNPKFAGKVGSQEPMCKRARDVTVKKIKRGPDQTVGKAATNARGRYSVPARSANGRFYATVKKATVENDDGQTVTCANAKSRTIRP